MDFSPTSKEASDIVSKVTRTFLTDHSTWTKQYDEIEDGYKYLAGDQYGPDQRQWFETQRRPTRIFNILFPIFNQTMGDFILNDDKVRVYPKPGGRREVAAAFEDLLDHTNMENDIKATFARIGLAGIIKSGYGYPYWGDDLRIDGSLIIDDVDEYEIIFDPTAIKDLADDAWYLCRSKWLTLDKILHLWPQHRSYLRQHLQNIHDADFYGTLDEFMVAAMKHPDFINEITGKYRILEFHEIEWKNAEVMYDPDRNYSEIWSLEGKKADLFRAAHPNMRIVRKNAKYKTVHNVVPGLNFLLDSGPTDLQDGTFDYVPFFAYNYGKQTIENFGIFRNAKDPQDDFNEWRNTLSDLVNKAANPGHTYNPNMLENPRDVEMYGRQPGINFKVKSAVQRVEDAIKRNDIPQLPFGPDQMSQEAADFLMKITGVTPNKLGVQETAQENASLFAQRVRQAQVAMQTIFNNWQKFKRRIYEKSIRIHQEHLDFERYYLITNPKTMDQAELIVNQQIGNQVVNDLSQGRYGVIAENMQNNPGARAVRFLEKTEVVDRVVQLFGGAIVNPMAIVSMLQWWLDESDLGDIDKFIRTFSQAVSGQMQQAQAAGQQQEAVELAGALMDLAKKKVDLEGIPGEASSQQEPDQYKR